MGVIKIISVFLLTLSIFAGSPGMFGMEIPTDWKKVEAGGKFTFWIPPALEEVGVRAIDSTVRRWEGKEMMVHFDYGRFSDPLTLYSEKKLFETASELIDNRSARIVSFERVDGWYLTAVHFPELGKDKYQRTLKLTLVVESAPGVSKEVPTTIVKSVRF